MKECAMNGRRLVTVAVLLALLLMPAALAEETLSFEEAASAMMEAGEPVRDILPGDLIPEDGDLPAGTGRCGPGENAILPTSVAPADGLAANAVPGRIELGVKEKYTLDAASLAPGEKLTYRSTKPKVATVSRKGIITAKGKGTARIRCCVGKTLLASCKVVVVAAPKKVSLGVKELTLGRGEACQLTPTITKGSHASFTWASENKSVVRVSKEGLVTGRKRGTAAITVRTQNGRTASVMVTVMGAPGKVTLNRSKASLAPGKTIRLKATLPRNTASGITWTSSDIGVAQVSASGKVTAIQTGSAVITASTFNGRSAVCVVTVSLPAPDLPEDDSVRYRALLIGEENFLIEHCPRNRCDVSLMSDMLNNVRGLYGGRYEITKEYDLDTSEILKAIGTAFADADRNDVSLFFIATHGDVDSSGEAAGELVTCPNDRMRFDLLAATLKEVPGKVIVILESCGSGAAVYANGNAGRMAREEAAMAFDRAAVRAFAEADPGIAAEDSEYVLDPDGSRSNTGELRVENKFYVLTASDYRELSWGMEDDYYDLHFNFFTQWLTDGVGLAGLMPADADGDRRTTLKELYSYISRVGDHYGIAYNWETYYQHVQVYPANSRYVLFVR